MARGRRPNRKGANCKLRSASAFAKMSVAASLGAWASSLALRARRGVAHLRRAGIDESFSECAAGRGDPRLESVSPLGSEAGRIWAGEFVCGCVAAVRVGIGARLFCGACRGLWDFAALQREGVLKGWLSCAGGGGRRESSATPARVSNSPSKSYHQVSMPPDFYLASGEHPVLGVYECVRRHRISHEKRDDLLLLHVDPPFPLDGDLREYISEVVIAARHVGGSLFPVNAWPTCVHILSIRDASLLAADSRLQPENVAGTWWGEIYETRASAQFGA